MGDSILTPNEDLTPAQVAKLLLNAGAPPDVAAQLTAIAKNESGFNAGILNDTPATGDYSVGLFQINYYGDLAAGRTAAFGTPQALSADPQAQANAALSLYKADGYQPWEADFNNGTAQSYLPIGQAAVTAAEAGQGTLTSTGSAIGGAVGSILGGPVGAITGGVGSAVGGGVTGGITDDIKKGGAYLLLIGGGIALLVLGVYKTASPSGKLHQTIENAAPAAAMAAA